MSRSNPTEKQANPSTRFFEWDAGEGTVRYYNKDTKKKIPVEGAFTFLLLDELFTIKGWSDLHESGIFSNEVKDTRGEVLVVKTFNGTEIAHGLYANIKDKVKSEGGKFACSLYIAFKDGGELVIGNLSLKGAGLTPWLDFTKKNRKKLYEGAITVTQGEKGKKGRVEFFPPAFALKGTTEETDAKAKELDQVLQAYFAEYFTRKKVEQVATEPAQGYEPETPLDVVDDDFEKYKQVTAEDDDIPF